MPPKRSKQSSFPVARIKRIMQQDDDVGKVAGASPLVVSKAVELFLQEMLQAIEKEARSKGTKKVSMYHVKRAVQNTPSLDFLKDLVASVPDPTADDGGDDADYASGSSKSTTKKPRASSSKKSAVANPAATTGHNGSAVGNSSSSATIKLPGSSLAQTHPHAGPSSASVSAPSQSPGAGGLGPRRVTIPVSSLLSSSADAGNGDEDEQPKQQQTTRQGKEEDDDYEPEEEEEEADDDEGDKKMAPASFSNVADGSGGDARMHEATAPAPTRKQEEDEDYDD